MVIPYQRVPISAALRSQQQYSAPEAETSLFKEIGGRTLSGVAAIGNVLDLATGASSIRDVLAGENPFDQFLSPFTFDNRVGGRELLEQYGVLGANQVGKLDWGDVAGLGTEMVLDPVGMMFLTVAHPHLVMKALLITNTLL